jgi:hypothetical protein
MLAFANLFVAKTLLKLEKTIWNSMKLFHKPLLIHLRDEYSQQPGFLFLK